jgi:hypothetical protein
MMGAQCDTCRRFAAGSCEGWLILVTVQPVASSVMSMITGAGGGTEVTGTFCSARCVAEFAYVLAATGSAGSPP